jgi:uridylate kinase
MNLLPFINKGYKFVIVVGGGKMARKYQSMLRAGNYDDYDQHYVGTVFCVANAVMLRAVFGELAEEKVVGLNDFENLSDVSFNKSVLLAGGAKPGVSSDYDAALLASYLNTQIVISLKDVNGVYDSDPDVNPSAKKLSKLSWTEYLNIVGNKVLHTPGGSLPVDVVAANFSQSRGIKFFILNGRDLNAFNDVMLGRDFDGSEIS